VATVAHIVPTFRAHPAATSSNHVGPPVDEVIFRTDAVVFVVVIRVSGGMRGLSCRAIVETASPLNDCGNPSSTRNRHARLNHFRPEFVDELSAS
jgi:hypothetical protein